MGLGAARILAQGVSWAATIVVVKLINPAGYGSANFALLLANWGAVIVGQGLPQLIASTELGNEKLAWSQQRVTRSALVAGLVVLGATPLLIRITPVSDPLLFTLAAILVALESARAIPYAALQFELDLRSIGKIDITRSAGASVSTLILATMGVGPIALVLGPVVGSTAALLLATATWRRREKHLAASLLKSEQANAWRLCAENSLWTVFSGSDQVIATQYLGTSQAGLLSFSRTLAAIPSEKLAALFIPLGTSILADRRDDPSKLRATLLLLTESTAVIVAVPLASLCALFESFVLRFVGNQWQQASGLVWILAAAAYFSSAVAFLPQIMAVRKLYVATLRVRMLVVSTTALAQLGGAILGGLKGLTLGTASMLPLSFLPAALVLAKNEIVSIRELLTAILRPIAVAGTVAAIMYFARQHLLTGPGVVKDLCIGGVGTITAVFGLYLAKSPTIPFFVSIVSDNLRQRLSGSLKGEADLANAGSD